MTSQMIKRAYLQFVNWIAEQTHWYNGQYYWTITVNSYSDTSCQLEATIYSIEDDRQHKEFLNYFE